MDRQTDRKIGNLSDKHTDGRTDRQTDKTHRGSDPSLCCCCTASATRRLLQAARRQSPRMLAAR
eukprot:6189504-Pleurochrysis_carterae.AAC.2